MDAHPEGMIPAQDTSQLAGDAHGKHHRDLGADAQKLDVPNTPQASQQRIDLVIRERQGITLRE